MDRDIKGRPRSILFFWMLIVSLVTFLTVAIFTALLIYYRRTDIIESADKRLLIAAEMSREILGPEYHDLIDDALSVSKDQFRNIVARNDDLCRRLNLQYIWSVLEVDHHLVFTSATHSDLNNPESPCAAFFDIHHDPNAFAAAMGPEMKPVFASFRNEWGEGRMVLVPRNDKRGRRYIFGTSVQLSKYNISLGDALLTSLLIGIMMMGSACIAAYALSRRISSRIDRLIVAADNMASGDLEISLPDIDFFEIQSLSYSLDAMRKELRHIIEALSESKEKYRLLVENLNAGVFQSTLTGRFLQVNRKVAELGGYDSIDEFMSKPAVDLYADPSDRERLKTLLLSQGEVKNLEMRSLKKDGTQYWISMNAVLLRNKDNAPETILGIINDITDRKQMEKEREKFQEQVLQSQKIEAIGTLAGGIAHDFNNMLGVITGNISYALSSVDRSDELYEILSDVQESSKQAQKLTHQLLTFSKGGAPIKKVSNVNKLINESAIFSARGSKVNCRFELSDTLWPAEIDEGQMNQVIGNLVINANQAMPGGGTITIKTENTAIESHSGLPLNAGRYIKITIEDEGIGISNKHLPHIFEPYFTTKQKGSGLGLATVYSVVKNHGGHITVYSEIDKGTVFNLYLPASSDNIIETTDKEINNHTGQGRILILDDQEAILRMAKRMLLKMGYDVETATDGKQAIAIYQKAHEAGRPFKLVILDLTIPGGLGGAETMQALLKMNPQLKAIVSSGYSNDPILANYEAYGFCGVALKPYTKGQLAKVFNQIFNA